MDAATKRLENVKRLGNLKVDLKRTLGKLFNIDEITGELKTVAEKERVEIVITVMSKVITVDGKDFQAPSISSGITIPMEMFEGTDPQTLVASIMNTVRNEVAAGAISLYTKDVRAPLADGG